MRLILISLALAAHASAASATLDRAQALYSHTDYAGALRLLHEASTDPAELRLFAECRYHLGDPKHAAEVLEKAASLAPGDALIQLWLGRAQGRRAETTFPLRAPGFAVKAREAFESAVKLDPKNREAVNDLFDFYLAAPGFIGGGPEKARGLIQLLDQADPVEAWHARSRLDEQKKQYESAEAALRHALEMEPANAGQMLNLARFFDRRGRHTESDEWSAKALLTEPENPRIIYGRAEIWVHARRNLNEARTLLRRYVALASLTPEEPSRAEAAKLLEKAEGS